MRRLGESRRKFFDATDRRCCRPSPINIPSGAPASPPDYHVEVQSHFYSVPSGLIRQVVEVRVTEPAIEVFHRGSRIASHVRSSVTPLNPLVC